MELKDIEVILISILIHPHKPANGQSVTLKSDKQLLLETNLVKTVNGLLTVTVMTPKKDTDGDYASPEEIKKAAHAFMRKHGVGGKIDTNHNLVVNDKVKIVESYLAENGDWKMVLDISEDSELLKAAKDGKITGVSIFGSAQKKHQKFTDNIIEKIEKFFAKINKEDSTMTEKEVINIIKKTLKEEYNLSPHKEDQEENLAQQVEKLQKEVLALSGKRETEENQTDEFDHITYVDLLRDEKLLAKMSKKNLKVVESLREKFLNSEEV